MTDFNKVESYYGKFDEWNRLDTPSGKLEYEQTMRLILKFLSKGDKVLDLGGGPGRYTIELAKLGYKMHLADLSENLLKQAQERVFKLNLENVKSINKVNAIDLEIYDDESFDVVLLFGPLYHLTDIEERQSCIKEVNRVLKPHGLVMASYIPYLTGTVGVIERHLNFPSQVTDDTLKKVFNSGVFNNNTIYGFQEGYYPTTMEIKKLFKSNGFIKKYVSSIRGFANTREEKLYALKDENESMYDLIIDLINKTAEEQAIIETCSHALFVGIKSS